MPRIARQRSKSKTYHILFQGNGLRDIFIDDNDKNKFLQLLFEKSMSEGFSIYAFCLMSNHVHILLSGEHNALGKLVKRINTSYVYYFNKKYDRIGRLFHDRYKSEPVETDAHLLAAVRYIHNNPVKAGMIKDPSDYIWSSYHYYTDYPQKTLSCLDPLFILEMFSEDIKEGKEQFVKFSKDADRFEFIDVVEDETIKDKEINSEIAAREFVQQFLKKNGLIDCIGLKGSKSLRNELIIELKEKSTLSIRQIASILGVSRGIVQRQQLKK